MNEQCIYFIQVQPGGPIKIGWTEKLVSRLLCIRGSCPYPVEVIGIIAGGDKEREANLHRTFKADRIHGEWFNPCLSLLAYIRDNTTAWKVASNRGVDHFNAILNDAKVVEIRRRHSEGESLSTLAPAFGVSSAAIHSAVSRRTWKHVD